MKVLWTENEIKPGIIVGKPGRLERCMIGYITSSKDREKRYSLNSCIDGKVNGPYTKLELAYRLNRNDEIPACLLDNLRFEFAKPK